MKDRTRLVTSILGVAALWFVPAVANAQVTIQSVKVTISGVGSKTAVWCDTALATCPAGAVRPWNLAGGVLVGAGQTLVLSQTGVVPNTSEGNFDTSDRADANATVPVRECTQADPCTVNIEINGVLVYTSPAGGDQLVAFNHDVLGNGPFNESQQYGAPINLGNYTLALGYADNEHSACPASGCFPNPFSGPYVVGLNGTFGICHSNCFDAGALLITGLAVQTGTGRMTGGGSVFTPDGTRVTHGFELHCDVNDLPNNLEINWAPANNFHLDVLNTAVCTNTAAIQAPPDAPFDTFVGTGTGKLNGVSGATIAFTLVDGGEPGTKDTATYVIKVGAQTVLTVPVAFLDKGNQQAHK